VTAHADAFSSVVLTRPPALLPLLARGALFSPLKRPRPDAGFPRTRLVLPGLRVDPARLTRYELLCGFAAGGDTLPITYPHVLGFPAAMRLMSERDFPLPLLGLVHTSIDITRRAPLAVTGTYEMTVHVEGLVPHRRGTQAVVVTEVRDGGEPVWESRSTYLARHRTAADPGAVGTAGAAGTAEAAGTAGTAGTAGAAGKERRESPQQEAPAQEEPSEQEPSEQEPLPAVAEWRLAADVGRRYAAVSGDRNPIHLFALTARLFGFPRAIAHGMWTVARCLAAHGTPHAAHVHAEFRAPVLLPGTVRYAAADGRFELRAPGDAGRLYVTGRVTAPAG
jgi:acyl dehydratase